MKHKIITAIGNVYLNNKLKEEKNYEVLYEDIPYKEGVLEILEKNNNFDLIFISEILPGNIEIIELIKKIKIINNKIKIIIFLEKEDKEKERKLLINNIFKIFYNNEIELEEIIKLINNEKKEINEELIKEINILKKIVLEKNKKSNKIKRININKIFKQNIFKKISKKVIKINNTENQKQECKIITIFGSPGVGKTIITILLSCFLKNKKILIIDLDSTNNCIYTILGLNKKSKRKENKKTKYKIIKFNNRIDIFLNYKKEIEKNNYENIIEENRKKYDLILIDTENKEIEKNNSFFPLIKNSNLFILILIPNLIEIKKANKILEEFINKYKINEEKIKIIINKKTINSINKNIILNIFYKFKIIGEIKLNNRYDLIINKNINKLYINIRTKIKTKKEYEKIIMKIYN